VWLQLPNPGAAVTERRGKPDVERRDEADDGRITRRSGDAGSQIASDNLEQAFLLLTEEERLVLIWKKAGFSDREIAKHLSRSASAVRETHRMGASKIHRSLDTRRSTDPSDDDLPLNCPLCGVRLALRGRVNDRRVFTCAVHGGFCIERSGRFRRTAD